MPDPDPTAQVPQAPAPAGGAAAARPAARPLAAQPPAPDVKTPAMKELFARVQAEQRRLGWSDAKLCEFATRTLQARDPYKRFQCASLEFLSRLRPVPMRALLEELGKQR
jgi:hypothetical protein